MPRNGLLNVLLLVLLVLGALSVVTSQHKARKLFLAMQQEKEHARQMEVEWGQLQLEQSTWAAPARVESIAAQRLQMSAPQKEQVRFIRLVAPSPQSSPVNGRGSDRPISHEEMGVKTDIGAGKP